MFKAPSFPHYLGSLIIAGLLAGIAYIFFQNKEITDNTTILIVGLIIGHLVGVFTISSTRSTSSTSNNGSKSAADSEIISLYIGNLAYNAQRDSLSKLFGQYGQVSSVRIMTDRETRRPRGYGFVEMEGSGALTAINKLDGTEFCGRTLRVSEANQR